MFLMRLQRLWQEHPPAWIFEKSIIEAECRNEVHRYLSVKGEDSTIEYQTFDGRTDLLIRESENLLRLEFKVWGRNDYETIPLQPLKYFTSGE